MSNLIISYISHGLKARYSFQNENVKLRTSKFISNFQLHGIPNLITSNEYSFRHLSRHSIY